MDKQTNTSVKILVVDDNKVNQLLVKNILKKFGFTHIETAESGKDAVEKIISSPFDLVLMDIQMPEMNGYEATRIIRSHTKSEIRNVPIIALSGDAADNEKVKAKEAGMNDYVVKPYTPEELYSTISKYIHSFTGIITASNSTNEGMDLSFLSKFTDGDKELTIQLIEIFLKQVPDSIQSIESGVSGKRWDLIFPIAHKVKSTVAIFEMENLRLMFATIEEHSRELTNLELIPDLLEKVKIESKSAIGKLKIELSKLKSGY